MKYQSLPIAATYRRFLALATKLRKMIANRSFTQLSKEEQHALIVRLRQLYTRLSRVIAGNKLKKALAGAALILTLGLNQTNAQTFGAPQVSPFNLEFAEEAYYFPQFVDIDDDGDFDIMAVSYVEYQSRDIRFFENTGTAESPSFAAPVAGPFGIEVPEDYITTLAFGDIDDDGDQDMLVGKYDGSAIFYYENTGSAANPAFAAAVQNPFNIETAQEFAVPSLLDLDDDGDLDLLITNYDDNTYEPFYQYQENIGTAESPDFAAAQIDPFGLGTDLEYAILPAIVDIDSDGDLDLMIGSGEYLGEDNYRAFVSFVENTGTAQNPAFAQEVNEPFNIVFPDNTGISILTMADMDNDGDADLLTFTYVYDPMTEEGKNVFMYFENTSPIVNATEVETQNDWSVFPTTTTDQLNWKLGDWGIEKDLSLSIYSVSGSRILTQNVGTTSGSIQVGHLLSGMYLIQLKNDAGEIVGTKRMIKE